MVFNLEPTIISLLSNLKYIKLILNQDADMKKILLSKKYTHF